METFPDFATYLEGTNSQGKSSLLPLITVMYFLVDTMRKQCEESLKFCKQQDTVSRNIYNLYKILPHLRNATTKMAATFWLGALLTSFFFTDQVHLQPDQRALRAIQQPRFTLDGFNRV